MKSTKKERQAYRTPQVIDYGNIKQITLSVGVHGADDRASGQKHRTKA